MKVFVLGSGTAVPSPVRRATGFLVEFAGTYVLIDGGSGTLQALAMQGVAPGEVAAGIYSHRHIDHTGDLAPLLFAMRVGGRSSLSRKYPIFAGDGFGAFFTNLQRCYPGWLHGEDWEPEIHELPLNGPGEADLPGGIRLRTQPANHSAGALHIRLEAGGRSVVFSGDTGPSEDLVELAAGTDLLLCECALNAPKEGVLHLWPAAVRDLLAAARPQRALLTHFYEEVDEESALKIAGASQVWVRRAFDGQVMEV